jgi:2-dehydro-3-deoxyphosphogalactonate aldolase
VNFGAACLCGAGTVLKTSDVERAHGVGARLIVSPNIDKDVVARTLQFKMTPMPGFATATEAFAAIAAGAGCLKLFPALSYGPAHLRALKSILPPDVDIFAVGGVASDQVEEWRRAGASGFAFGSELFKPEYKTEEIADRARRLVGAVRKSIGG